MILLTGLTEDHFYLNLSLVGVQLHGLNAQCYSSPEIL